MLLSSGKKQFKTLEKVLPKFNDSTGCFQLNDEETIELSDLITYIIESNPGNDYINEFDKTVLMSALNKIKKNRGTALIYNLLEIIKIRKIIIDYLRIIDDSL